MVGKDGNTTDLTVGRYAGLVSFIQKEFGIESVELGIYDSGCKTAEVFSAKGDSGYLIWHMTNGKARIVGQLHSRQNGGGSTSNHVTYCTPGWYFLDQIKSGSSTPTSTPPPGELENNINGSSLSSASCFRTHS